MPYDNPYNRRIANEVGDWNHRFATLYAYSPVDGRHGGYSEGGSNAGVLFQLGNASKRDGEDNIINDDLKLPEVYYVGNDAGSGDMTGGAGFAEGTYRDTGIGHQEGASTGVFKEGGSLFSDLVDGFGDLGHDIGNATNYVLGRGTPKDFKELGRRMGMKMKGRGLSGGSWWDSLKSGIAEVAPHLLLGALGAGGVAEKEVGGNLWDDIKGVVSDVGPEVIGALAEGAGKRKRGRPAKKGKGKEIGGAILGNPDPYPKMGNSVRLAGRGRGRPKKASLVSANGDLLAMPGPILANGIPPKAQLRGAYGGAKPPSKVEEKVLKAVKKKLEGGKNLSGVTAPLKGGDGRKARAEIVKKVMKEKGLSMIEASSYVKKNGLYKASK
jgi:hypothetical protein